MKKRALRSLWLCSLTLCCLWVVACATNPVTGKRQLALISEAQEIEMGREADKDVVASIGLYPDESMQHYVQALGARIAAATERPNLPWTFRVVDDAAVNAFAIPGGFIYVTRGIMTHLNSEAELAAILGHEIGHVTARHSVSQMSKQQLAQVGLAAGMILSPEFAQFGNLAQAATRPDVHEVQPLRRIAGGRARPQVHAGRRIRPPEAGRMSSGCSRP